MDQSRHTSKPQEKDLTLTDSDKALIRVSLIMFTNYIETGNVHFSGEQATNADLSKMIKPLNETALKNLLHAKQILKSLS